MTTPLHFVWPHLVTKYTSTPILISVGGKKALLIRWEENPLAGAWEGLVQDGPEDGYIFDGREILDFGKEIYVSKSIVCTKISIPR